MYIEYIIKRTTWLHVCVHETLPKCNKQCKVGEGHLNSYFYKNSKFYKVCNDSKSNVCFNIMVGFGNWNTKIQLTLVGIWIAYYWFY